jgi:hypothetical protein
MVDDPLDDEDDSSVRGGRPDGLVGIEPLYDKRRDISMGA